MKPDEAKLVEACLRHDQKACRQLYDSYAPQMFGICMRYARSREAAEDILHDGFIKVFENLGKLRDTSQLVPWMHSVMVNTAISFYRHDSHIGYLPDMTDHSSMGSDADEIYGNIDVEIIMKAIQKLPTAYRMAFNLCEIEGYSFAEASKELGIVESTVRSNFFRARKILARELSEFRKR